MLVGLVAVVMVFGIPLSAILGNVWLKGKRLDAESGGGGELGRRVAQLEATNRDLRSRVEVLETIVTSDSPAQGRVRVEAARAAHHEAAEVEAASRGAAAGSRRV